MDFYEVIGEKIKSGQVRNKKDLQTLKIRLAKELSLDFIPSDVEILNSGNFSEVAKGERGNGIIGVIDGFSPVGVENENDKNRPDNYQVYFCRVMSNEIQLLYAVENLVIWIVIVVSSLKRRKTCCA